MRNDLIVNEATLEDSDRKLLVVMKNYVNDMLDNTYNALINEIFVQIQNGSLSDAQDFDNYHFFKFSSFMIQIQRMKAQEAHNDLKKEAFEKAKIAYEALQKEDTVKNLFNQGP